jgi:3-hydroxyacyl-CoA dehydrogenase
MDIKLRTIKKVAVLGTGVMGAQITAHFANAGFEVVMFGIVSDQNHKNFEADNAIKILLKSKPAAFASKSFSNRIIAANYDEHLELLDNCDFVIEVISENIAWKKDLYQKVLPHLKPTCILASNTSAIPLRDLAADLPDWLKSRFIGVHFFNPPRYMPLLELTAHQDTDSKVVDFLEGFLVTKLGKGVIKPKDMPGFVGNRIGVFSIVSINHHAKRFNLPPDLVDELTGRLIGRPRTATYRTMDLVGLDTYAMVVKELAATLDNDPWQKLFYVPDWIEKLIESGAVGSKVKRGVYEKRGADIWVFDVDKGDYRKAKRKQVDAEVKNALKQEPAKQFASLIQLDNPQAKFLCSLYRDLFHYCAYYLGDIAHSAKELDLAMRWGYGWDHGPFEIWQDFGWQTVANYLRAESNAGNLLASVEVPKWALDPNRTGVHDDDGSWAADIGNKIKSFTHPVYKQQIYPIILSGESAPVSTTYFENEAIRYWSLEPEIGILSFKTKMHVLSYDVIQGINQALDIAETRHKALIIWQESAPFCAGANLYEVLMSAKYDKLDHEAGLLGKLKQKVVEGVTHLPKLEADLPTLKEVIHKLQQVFMRLKHGSVPTIAAVNGLALGGGCELLLHCDRVVASLESYIGLVEIGVGVLPAGGGCKEMTLRAAIAAKGNEIFPFVSKYFENIAKATVATGAVEAKQMGYLRAADKIVMNPNEVLAVAHSEARALSNAYTPPWRDPIKVTGNGGRATIQAQLLNYLEGDFISKHDYNVATRIATIMTGGDVAPNTLVTDEYLLNLEVENFIALMRTKQTQDRIEYMLKTGKPLRN